MSYRESTTAGGSGMGCLTWVLLFAAPLPVSAYILFIKKDASDGLRKVAKIFFAVSMGAVFLACVVYPILALIGSAFSR